MMVPSGRARSTGSDRNVPACSLLAFHVRPASLDHATPAWRKLLATVSNCLQPTAMRLGNRGSWANEGSLAASPTMFCCWVFTFTWVIRTVEGMTPRSSVCPGGEVRCDRASEGWSESCRSTLWRSSSVMGVPPGIWAIECAPPHATTSEPVDTSIRADEIECRAAIMENSLRMEQEPIDCDARDWGWLRPIAELVRVFGQPNGVSRVLARRLGKTLWMLRRRAFSTIQFLCSRACRVLFLAAACTDPHAPPEADGGAR